MRTMTDAEAHEFIAHNKFGLLSLARAGKAYAVPLYYGYDGRHVYVHTRPGLKAEYMSATQEACFTVVRVMGLDDWASVHVFGALERLGDGPERMQAFQALMSVPLPPEFGESQFGEPLRGSQGSITYRLTPARMSGRYSKSPGEPTDRA